MSKYAVILDKVSPHTYPMPQPAQFATSSRRATGRRPYAELASKLFHSGSTLRVVAFVSVNPGAGVTRTVRYLSAELASPGRIVTIVDGALHHSDAAAGVGGPEDILEIGVGILGAPRNVEPESLSRAIAKLRERYACILLDCGSLESSTDLVRLAPYSDGVVLVVEAGVTNKDQIERAARVIRETGGTLLGCVLNKRRYPIPGWLYRLL